MYYDQQARHLPDLQTGEKIRMQREETWQLAVVEKEQEQPKSYIVHTPVESWYRLQQKHLRQTSEKENDDSDKNNGTETSAGRCDP